MLLEQTLSFINTVLVVGLLIIILVYVGVIAKQKGWGVALKAPFKPVMLIPLIIVGIFSYIRLGINFLEPSELGVVVSVLSPGGYNNKVYRSGLHWTFPFLERMDRYSYAWQIYEMTANPYETSSRNNSTNNKITQTTINTAHVTDTPVKARTADGQEVSVDCSIIYQVEPDQIIRVSIEWQSRYVQDFLRPIARGLIRTQVSQYTAAEVNSSKSLALERDINQQLRIALEDKGFGLERFILRSITFTPEYATSIEQKQIALENALRSEHEGDRIRTLARADADAVRIRAESEANALTVISNTLQSNRTLLSYRYIDKLSPQLRVMIVPNNAPFFMNLPLLDDPVTANTATISTPRIAPSSTLTTTPLITSTVPSP
jgi:regulator of protease activity HflC (stomatin/prohibitin superfamily)